MTWFIADFARKVKLRKNSLSSYGETVKSYSPGQSNINPNMITGSNILISNQGNTFAKTPVKRHGMQSGRPTINRVNIYADDGDVYASYDKTIRPKRGEVVDYRNTPSKPLSELEELNKKRRAKKPQKPKTSDIKPKLSRKNMLLLGGGLAATGLTAAGLYVHNKNKNKKGR